MKKFLINLTFSITTVLLWAFALTYLGVWYFREYSVVPSFPYYYILLLNVKDAAYALWGYFDGVHYLRLITAGYADIGSQAFFPLYPLIVRSLSQLLGISPYVAGIATSLFSLTLSITLIKYLFPKRKYVIILAILFFPTSFFFSGLYTESLFLLLSLGFFLALKHKYFFIAAILAGLASATRLVGIILAISLVYELVRLRPVEINLKYILKGTLLLVVSLSGLISYLIYLWLRFKDPLMFLHVQSMFGAERSGDNLIFLPQVLYRYIKMILTVETSSFLYQRIWLELTMFTAASIAWYKNLRFLPFSYSIYVIISILLPTFTGTLSSFPRYILVLLPFLIPGKMSKSSYYLYCFISFSLLIYLFKFYCHGEFVS